VGKIREGFREILYEPHLEGPWGDWIGRGEERYSSRRQHLVKLGPAMIRMELMGVGGRIDKVDGTKLQIFLYVMLGS